MRPCAEKRETVGPRLCRLRQAASVGKAERDAVSSKSPSVGKGATGFCLDDQHARYADSVRRRASVRPGGGPAWTTKRAWGAFSARERGRKGGAVPPGR